MSELPPYLIEPIWQQFSALLPERRTSHPLGCHRPRIPDRVAFEKLRQILVFGCAYERIADGSCSATTLRDRRDEWIESEVREKLRGMALEGAYDRLVGLELSEVAVDGCTTRAPGGGEKAAHTARRTARRWASNARWWWTLRASRWAWSGYRPTATTPRCWSPRWRRPSRRSAG